MKPCENVILLDVDKTLFNDDRIVQELQRHLRRSLGDRTERRYMTILKRLEARLGYTDYLGALQRYRLEHPHDPHILRVSCFLIEYPFRNLLKPGALRVIRKCRQWGPVVVLSDGDAVFQPHKIMASGIWKAVRGHVLVFVHKEKMLNEVERFYPARHYVMVDDKLPILQAMKKVWKSRLTTVLVRQDHNSTEKIGRQRDAKPDISIAHVRDLPRALHRYTRKGNSHTFHG